MGFGLLKRRKGEVSCDGWKVVKKFFQGVSAINVIRLSQPLRQRKSNPLLDPFDITHAVGAQRLEFVDLRLYRHIGGGGAGGDADARGQSSIYGVECGRGHAS